jgi:hypothetical protein
MGIRITGGSVKLKLAKDLSLPIESVTEKFAWLGRTGSGKTYGAMKLAEEMLAAGAQVGALDPVGVWRALRVPAEKGGPSFDVVVFGGLYGDLPLEPTAGELIADLVVDRGLSFVIDVSQFIPSEQQRFAKAFADRFFHRKKAAPSAVHLFLEECQEFIPENPSGLEAMTLGAFQRLWKLGRNFGIGGSLISQRPQEIAKKALNMSGTLFAFQMTGPQERKAIRAWVADQGIATDIEGVLQKLQVGEPHVESPTFLEASKTIRILLRVTADLSSTPKVGAATAAKRALTPIDVEQLRTSLASTIEKAKADDPRELRKRIAELERQVADVAKAGNKITAQITPALTDADRALLDTVAERIRAAMDTIERLRDIAVDRVRQALDDFNAEILEIERRATGAFAGELERKGVDKIADTLAGILAAPPARAAGLNRPAVQQRPAVRVITGTGPLPAGEQAVLTVALQYPTGVDRKRVTILTGYKRSTRDAYIARLNQRGYVLIDGPTIRPTTEGQIAIGVDFEPLPTGAALAEHWRQRLPEGERKILDVLLGAGGHNVTREAIDEATGYARSSRDAYLQRMKARGIVEMIGRGQVRAAGELF